MRRSFCLIALATNMLEGWDISSVQYQGAKIYTNQNWEKDFKYVKHGTI